VGLKHLAPSKVCFLETGVLLETEGWSLVFWGQALSLVGFWLVLVLLAPVALDNVPLAGNSEGGVVPHPHHSGWVGTGRLLWLALSALSKTAFCHESGHNQFMEGVLACCNLMQVKPGAHLQGTAAKSLKQKEEICDFVWLSHIICQDKITLCWTVCAVACSLSGLHINQRFEKL